MNTDDIWMPRKASKCSILDFKICYSDHFWTAVKQNNRVEAVLELRASNRPWMRLHLAIDIVNGMFTAKNFSKL
jgi:hypothetical protein